MVVYDMVSLGGLSRDLNPSLVGWLFWVYHVLLYCGHLASSRRQSSLWRKKMFPKRSQLGRMEGRGKGRVK